jgi:hypothetical protein
MFAMVLFASYAALGLAVSLNPNTSGGAECAASVTEALSVVNGVDDLDPAVSMSGGGDRDLPIGLGRIVRDEAGRIIAVETNDDVDPPSSDHRSDLVEEAAAAIRTPEGQSWVSFGRTSDAEKPNTALTQGGYGTPIASGDNRFDLTCHGILLPAVWMNCVTKRSLTSFVGPFRDSLPKVK